MTLNVSVFLQGGWKLSPATVALLVGNAAVFVAMLFHGAGLWHSSNDVQLGWGANFGPATVDGQWWRLGTAMFLHFGLLHLAVNMWALWDSCRLAERLYGHWRFLAIYGSSGIAGNLLSLLVHGEHAISGGASGAIFGAYGALLVWLWRERDQVHPVDFKWLFGGGTVFAIVVIGMGLLIPGIDNAAHLGGMICGALAGRILAYPSNSRSPAPGSGRWVAAGAALFLTLAMVAALPSPRYRWSEEERARSQIRKFMADDKRISERWRAILQSSAAPGASFEEISARIDSDITRQYQGSFEELSAIDLDPAAPSGSTLDYLKRYALVRGEASHALAQSLLQGDSTHARESLEAFRRAPAKARSEANTPSH